MSFWLLAATICAVYVGLFLAALVIAWASGFDPFDVWDEEPDDFCHQPEESR